MNVSWRVRRSNDGGTPSTRFNDDAYPRGGRGLIAAEQDVHERIHVSGIGRCLPHGT